MKLNDNDYLRIAYIYAQENSDDPRTQTGAILVNDKGNVVAYGANCIPNGVRKTDIRKTPEFKADFIGHAERNCIFNAAKKGVCTNGLTMYAPWAACAVCAQAIIEAGITKLVVHKQIMDKTPERWEETITNAMKMLLEGKVEIVYHNDPNIKMGILFNGKRV